MKNHLVACKASYVCVRNELQEIHLGSLKKQLSYNSNSDTIKKETERASLTNDRREEQYYRKKFHGTQTPKLKAIKTI